MIYFSEYVIHALRQKIYIFSNFLPQLDKRTSQTSIKVRVNISSVLVFGGFSDEQDLGTTIFLPVEELVNDVITIVCSALTL